MEGQNLLGKEGEKLAYEYMQQQGYTILHKNWQYRHLEIDIIAKKDNKLHFIEVKTRSSLKYGYPEESVTRKKFQHLKKAAEVFLWQNPGWKLVEFNVLAILLLPNTEPEYVLFRDVYC